MKKIDMHCHILPGIDDGSANPKETLAMLRMRPWYIGHRLVRGLRDPEDLKRSLKAFWRLKDSLLK